MAVTLPPYPQDTPPGWCAPFIGLPYEEGERGPDRFDCWGLAMLVSREQFGVVIPTYEGVHWGPGNRADRNHTAAVIEDEKANYTEIEAGQERPGDLIVLRIASRPLHVGIIAAPGWMIHACDGSDSALERYDGMFWRNRVEAFYRRLP